MLAGMQPPDREHDRASEQFTTAVDRARAVTAGASCGLEQPWERGLRETLQRLDEFQEGMEEALRLTRLLVDRMPGPA